MTSHRTDAERRLHELLETAARVDASEDDIKRRVANLIEVLADDQTARQEVQTSTGIIDILVGNVIIEAKIDADRLEPAPSWARGDVNIRRQYAASQLQDYVNERYRGIKSETSIFDGYTTNGTTWHRWAVTVGGVVPELVWTKDLTQSTLDAAAQSGIDRASIIDDLFNDITSTLASRPPPPDDLQQLLSDLPDAAYRRAREMLGQPDFETKRNLWRDLMRGAFVLTPGETESDIRLFATHSILVEIARTVANDVLTPGTFLGERNGSSFSAWVNAPISDRADDDHGADSSNAGFPLSARIAREVGRYNWRLASSDILKGVYHDFIPTDVRHDFGEYYTPDWLAEAMCEEILDDGWCRASIQRAADPSDDLHGCGMLEPSCGSGTFLRAAVRRLIPFAESLTDDRVEQADMICRLLYAFDIHPVAVELAKSTMLSALPDTPSNGMSAINVYLADSLRWVEDTGMRLMSVGGILINVPAIGDYPSFDVVVPSEIVQHPEFADVVADIFMFRDNIRILRERLRSLGFSQETIHSAIELAESMKTLSAQGRNDVWQWYITNVAQANRLHARGFDRILGNPPWITRKDMTPDRQVRHRAQSLELGVWKGGANLATQNNLAALFVAKVTRDYATDGTDWKVGFVLPWSALQAAAWSEFRRGRWNSTTSDASDEWRIDLGLPPWDLKGVANRPFPQSDACVIFGKSTRGDESPTPLPNTIDVWSADGITVNSPWNDIKLRITRCLRVLAAAKASHYLDYARNGANMFPKGLVRVDTDSIREGGRGNTRFSTQPSKKGAWKGVQIADTTVESECILDIVFPENIGPFRVLQLASVAIPPTQAFVSGELEANLGRLRFFSRHWTRVEQLYSANRSPNGPDSMFDMLNHLGKLASQLESQPMIRVVYPKSGNHFFGAVVNGSIIVDNALYYVNFTTHSEARYICALFASDALQNAYRNSRVTDRHYDKHPLRAVPIPAYNLADALHAQLALLGKRAETVAAQVPLSGSTASSRTAIRDALREDGVMQEIDRYARELLPGHADPA